jgi:hypothetical protein
VGSEVGGAVGSGVGGRVGNAVGDLGAVVGEAVLHRAWSTMTPLLPSTGTGSPTAVSYPHSASVLCNKGPPILLLVAVVHETTVVRGPCPKLHPNIPGPPEAPPDIPQPGNSHPQVPFTNSV